MDFLYSLYDALVSINVPGDKARAVVDAMERDMGTTLATKADLQAVVAANKADLQALSVATKADLQVLAAANKADLQALSLEMDAKVQLLSRDIKTLESTVERDLRLLESRMTVRLGSMMVTAVGIVYALQKLL